MLRRKLKNKKRRVLHSRDKVRFGYALQILDGDEWFMVMSPSNGLSMRVFLSSRLAHSELKRLREEKIFGNGRGKVVRLMVVDYDKPVDISIRGRKVDVNFVKKKKGKVVV